VKRLAHRAFGCLQRFMKLVHLGNEIRRDTDFLGYEAFCSLNQATFGGLPREKAGEKAHKAGFAQAGDKVLSGKAA